LHYYGVHVGGIVFYSIFILTNKQIEIMTTELKEQLKNLQTERDNLRSTVKWEMKSGVWESENQTELKRLDGLWNRLTVKNDVTLTKGGRLV